MAITVTKNLTDISTCESTTGWSGGTNLLVQALSWQGTNALGMFVDNTTSAVSKYDIGVGTDMSNGEHIYAWMVVFGNADTKALGGYRIYAEDTSGNWYEWFVGGVDTHPNGGWNIFTVDLNATPDLSSGTLDTSNIRYVGVRFKTTTDAFSQGQNEFNNCFWDVLRYGTGLTVTSLATDTITPADIFAVDSSNTNKYGVMTKPAGIDAYVQNGKITYGGTGTESINLVLTDEALFFPANDLVSSTFHSIETLGNTTGTTDIEITGSFISSSGVPFNMDLDQTNLDTILLNGNSISNCLAPTFGASQTITNNVLSSCGTAYPKTSTFTGYTIKNSAETASYAMFLEKTHNVANGNFADNYWDIGVTPAVSGDQYTLVGDKFSNSTAHIRNTHATNAVEILATEGANPSTSSTAGGVVTITLNPVALGVTVKDESDESVIASAAVTIKAANGDGPLPYQDSVTITRVGDVATVAHTAHGLSTGQKVEIKGAEQNEYNRIKTITKIDDNSYSYAVLGSPTTPATGTIVSTGVIIDGVTNASGYISDTRTYSANQDFVGLIQRGTTLPIYKARPQGGTVNKDTGLSLSVLLTKD